MRLAKIWCLDKLGQVNFAWHGHVHSSPPHHPYWKTSCWKFYLLQNQSHECSQHILSNLEKMYQFCLKLKWEMWWLISHRGILQLETNKTTSKNYLSDLKHVLSINSAHLSLSFFHSKGNFCTLVVLFVFTIVQAMVRLKWWFCIEWSFLFCSQCLHDEMVLGFSFSCFIWVEYNANINQQRWHSSWSRDWIRIHRNDHVAFDQYRSAKIQEHRGLIDSQKRVLCIAW